MDQLDADQAIHMLYSYAILEQKKDREQDHNKTRNVKDGEERNKWCRVKEEGNKMKNA